MSSGGVDLVELSHQLKQERLFINSEREQLQNLYTDVRSSAEQIHCTGWLTRQQKNVLNDLVRATANTTATTCCHKSNLLEEVKFVDAYKRLSYHESKIGEFLKNLRLHPQIVATLLIEAEKNGAEKLQRLARIVMSGIFNNLVFSDDEHLALQVLKSLLEQQFTVHHDPRRLLRKESCAFAVFFKLVVEGMYSARVFLTAVLHQPVMNLLMEDEWFYDIDPERALHRFSGTERQRRFGTAGTDEYQLKLKQYRISTNSKLSTITSRFIAGLKVGMYCFPKNLAWIVSQMYRTLAQREEIGESEARAACGDLVLALFICPALCDPEPYGIIADVPISYIARHNLMQVAQILQVLALSNIEEIDSRQRDLYQKWEQGCLDFLLGSLTDTPCTDQPPVAKEGNDVARNTAVYMTFDELLILIQQAQNAQDHVQENTLISSIFSSLMSDLPAASKLQELQQPNRGTSPGTTPTGTPPGTPASTHRARIREKAASRLPGVAKHRDSNQLQVTYSTSSTQVTDDLPSEVLIISLGVPADCPGMEAEEKIIEQEMRRKKKYNSLIPGADDPISESDILANEKRTRFSLSQDQDSIATSDNLEGSTSDASSHSIGSDIENDNLSDMVSANVSGRGTPSISGRESPLSEPREDNSQPEAGAENPEPRVHGLENVPVVVKKSNREDVTDKFQKFELERDEIKSTVSDSWSTDVLASDSEPPEQNQLERLVEVNEERLLGNGGGMAGAMGPPSLHMPGMMGVAQEMGDAASDAWSMDVLASDTSEMTGERLLELDQEELGSVSGRSQTQESETGESLDAASALVDSVSVSSAGGSSDNRGSELFNDSSDGRLESPRSATSSRGQHRQQLEAMLMPRNMPVSPRGMQWTSRTLQRLNGPQTDAFEEAASQKSEDSGGSRERDDGTLINNKSRGNVTAVPTVNGHSNEMETQLSVSPLSKEDSQASASPEFSSSFLSDSGFSHSSMPSKSSLTNGDNFSPCKPTEQQNPNLDAHRLSMSELASFDPLAIPASFTEALSHHRKADNEENQNIEKLRSQVEQLNLPQSDASKEIEPPQARVAWQSDQEASAAPAVPQANPHHAGARPKTSNPRLLLNSEEVSRDKNSMDWESTPETTRHKESADSRSDKQKKRFFSIQTFKERLSRRSDAFSSPQMQNKGKRKAVKGEDGRNVAQSVFYDSPGEAAGGSTLPVNDSSEDLPSKAASQKGADSTPQETSDDILAKYRRTSPNKAQQAAGGKGDGPDGKVDESSPSKNKVDHSNSVDETPVYDPRNLETCRAFVDAKKKLRLVLSTADFTAAGPTAGPGGLEAAGGDEQGKDSDLVMQLKAQLAEAVNLQDKTVLAQMQETVRCLHVFSLSEVKRLLRVLREEHRSRSAYTNYLLNTRQTLLMTLAHLQRLLTRVKRDKTLVNNTLLSTCVRTYMQGKEKDLNRFITEFQKLSVSDEKTDLVESFLQRLYSEMEADPMWQACTEDQVSDARWYIERYLMGHIYTHAMFPNGDGDIARDQIFHQHIKLLAQNLSPNHKDLKIPRIYHHECPWPSAQSEIVMINAFKTPKDKLQCILRMSSSIMNLLSLARGGTTSAPAADDFMPVLIYVLISANPPNLLSTVQFVESFYGKRLGGEEQYWWTQFASAVEFIKTMQADEV